MAGNPKRRYRGPEFTLEVDPDNGDALYDPLLGDDDPLKGADSLADIIGDDRMRRRAPRASDEGFE